MRVLVACEFSGIAREAFRARGHHAWSCDLLPSEDETDYHVTGNVLRMLDDTTFDLMIAHPPCTFLANSGAKHLYKGMRKENGVNSSRWCDMQLAASFFLDILGANIPRIAVENPIMHGHAKEIIGVEQSQIIQPWQFGHGETKATCLWLKNLPKLVPTNIVDGRQPRVHFASPGPDRWKERSRTLQGIADAMADQWGGLDLAEAAE